MPFLRTDVLVVAIPGTCSGICSEIDIRLAFFMVPARMKRIVKYCISECCNRGRAGITLWWTLFSSVLYARIALGLLPSHSYEDALNTV